MDNIKGYYPTARGERDVSLLKRVVDPILKARRKTVILIWRRKRR
ncbi:MAG TPA: hypothetical protein PLM25_04285 [Limnochordia bacterium]|nr:hypothetical protein [Limnochordia bacterium]